MKNGHQLTVFTEEFPQLFIVHVIAKVFNVDICKFFGSGTQFSLALFARFEATHKSVYELTMKKFLLNINLRWNSMKILCHGYSDQNYRGY